MLRRCAVFLGPAGKEELQALGPAAVEAIRSESGFEGEDWRQYLDALDRDGSPTAYAFRSGRCGRVGGYSDCD